MKIAVTAANGQLGRKIVSHLLKMHAKEDIIGIARTPEKAKDMAIDIRKGDYNNQEDFEKAFQGINIAIIISGMAAPLDRITQHQNIINAAKIAGVQKIVYNSIFGTAGGSLFDDIIASNRKTEEDVQNSGLEWVIGRNGLYIDADVKAVPDYERDGRIINCAGDKKCAYTSRDELAFAYARMATDASVNGKIFNLCGKSITQHELAENINAVFGTQLVYQYIPFEDYLPDRIEAHGEFFGGVIAGIYKNIHAGVFHVHSDYAHACGRHHKSILEMLTELKKASQ